MTGFVMDPSKLNFLATNYDPAPILASMGQVGGSGLQATPQQRSGFANVINPWTGGGGGVAAPTPGGSSFSGIDPKLLGQFGGMLNTPPQQPHFIGGAAPHPSPQVQMHAVTPAMSAGGGTQVPGLAAILQGRR